MWKQLFFVALSCMLIGCVAQNEQYYRTHPKILQEAMQNCPARAPSKNVSCIQAEVIAKEIAAQIAQLQDNPQAFGQKILKLQETLDQQTLSLRANPNVSELKIIIDTNKNKLAEYLALVGWLESPEN